MGNLNKLHLIDKEGVDFLTDIIRDYINLQDSNLSDALSSVINTKYSDLLNRINSIISGESGVIKVLPDTGEIENGVYSSNGDLWIIQSTYRLKLSPNGVQLYKKINNAWTAVNNLNLTANTDNIQITGTIVNENDVNITIPLAQSNKSGLVTSAERQQIINLPNTYAPINSPQFTGTPIAPTPSEDTNTNQIATTAFVQALLSENIPTYKESDIGGITTNPFKLLPLFTNNSKYALVKRTNGNLSILYLADEENVQVDLFTIHIPYARGPIIIEQESLIESQGVLHTNGIPLIDIDDYLLAKTVSDTSDKSDRIATTAFVQNVLAILVAGRFKFVQTLPVTGESGYIYLTPHTHSIENDLKDEWIWDATKSKFELIGNTDIDLSNYWNMTNLIPCTNTEILQIWTNS